MSKTTRKRVLSILLSLLLILSFIDTGITALAVNFVNAGVISLIPSVSSLNPDAQSNGMSYAIRAVSADEVDLKDKLVILHTNDAHGRDVAGSASIGTAGVAQLKKDFEAMGAKVLLVSAGDAIQGTPLVNIDEGKSAVEFLKAAGYDLLIPGNHEFDFGKENLLEILKNINTFDVLSANIFEGQNDLLFKANKIYEFGDIKVGVFGLTTPETYTKTHPDKIAGLAFLMDEPLYKEAQAQVNELKNEGCDLIVCVGHLGVDAASEPNRSTDVIAHVNGIDLWIDGHSHTQINRPGQPVTQLNGTDKTLLVSAKQYLEYVGAVIYDLNTKKIEDAYLIGPSEYSRVDGEVALLVDKRNAEVNEILSAPIGTTEVTLYGKNTTSPPGVRMSETNLGDFAADALLWVANYELGFGTVDAAITNGGGIRDSIPTDGRAVSAQNPYKITMMDMVTVFPFGNTVTVIAITGEQLLEALEAATYCTPAVVGAFPQVAGIEFEIHTYVPYTNGPLYPSATYYAPANPGSRIRNVKVGGVPLNLTKTYYIATNDFTAAGGDTYAVFKQCSRFTNLGVAMEDALVEYLDNLGGTIPGNSVYAAPQGRIIMRPTDSAYYKVTFNSDGGSAVPGQTVDMNGKAVKPDDPKKDGFTFTGWNLGDKPYDFEAPVTQDITLVAQWRSNPITSLLISNKQGAAVPAAVTAARNSTIQFDYIVNKDALHEGVVWSVSNSAYATVNTETGAVTVKNLTGTVILTAKDPLTGISHSIVLRIV